MLYITHFNVLDQSHSKGNWLNHEDQTERIYSWVERYHYECTWLSHSLSCAWKSTGFRLSSFICLNSWHLCFHKEMENTERILLYYRHSSRDGELRTLLPVLEVYQWTWFPQTWICAKIYHYRQLVNYFRHNSHLFILLFSSQRYLFNNNFPLLARKSVPSELRETNYCLLWCCNS